jgi:hypothetical protein
MTTLTFSNGKDVLVHYVTDIVLSKRRYKIEYEHGVKKFQQFAKDEEQVIIEDNFNVYEVQDKSWKFRKVYDLKTRNEIPRNGLDGRALDMIVFVGETNQYYQLTKNPRSAWTEDTDWTVFATGTDFEKSLPLRPQFRQIEYKITQFREFAKEQNLGLKMKVDYKDAGNIDPNVRITLTEYDLNPAFPITKTDFDLNLYQGRPQVAFPNSPYSYTRDPIVAALAKIGVDLLDNSMKGVVKPIKP